MGRAIEFEGVGKGGESGTRECRRPLPKYMRVIGMQAGRMVEMGQVSSEEVKMKDRAVSRMFI